MLVRSAVNQIGRDGGKVISNQIYGDSHSMSIRVAPSRGSQTVDTTNLTEKKSTLE